jgi:protoporphyrinogen/coproporphyrinogen III oxidase
MPQRTSVIVVGAGIAGLACARRLHALGIEVLLLEANAQPGGLIASPTHDGYLFESGPQSFQFTPPIAALIDDLQLRDDLLTADADAPRYIVKHGRLEKLPMSPPALLASQLLGIRSRLKIASEPFRRTQPPGEEESVAAFVHRKFGHEILEYLVAPFVSGVYAGDPEQLSLKAAFPSLEQWEREHGSIIRGAMKSRKASAAAQPPQKTGPKTKAPPLCSFRHGVATLTNALAHTLGDRAIFNAPVTAITPTSEGVDVTATIAGQRDTFQARAIVLATPAYMAGQLLSPSAPQLAEPLSAISYAPIAVASAAYRREQIAHPANGFGFLVPRAEKIRTLGTVFNSSLFPGRAPASHLALTSFLGGATDLDAIHFSDAQLSRIAHNDNARLLGISGGPVTTHVTRWPRALPQYNLGHAHLIARVRTLLDATPTLFLTGNYLEGPALTKCVENAHHTATTVSNFVSTQPS